MPTSLPNWAIWDTVYSRFWIVPEFATNSRLICLFTSREKADEFKSKLGNAGLVAHAIDQDRRAFDLTMHQAGILRYVADAVKDGPQVHTGFL